MDRTPSPDMDRFRSYATIVLILRPLQDLNVPPSPGYNHVNLVGWHVQQLVAAGSVSASAISPYPVEPGLT